MCVRIYLFQTEVQSVTIILLIRTCPLNAITSEFSVHIYILKYFVAGVKNTLLSVNHFNS
jgi:hypothetical protein